MTIINCSCIVVYQSVYKEYIQGGAQKADKLYDSVTFLKNHRYNFIFYVVFHDGTVPIAIIPSHYLSKHYTLITE